MTVALADNNLILSTMTSMDLGIVSSPNAVGLLGLSLRCGADAVLAPEAPGLVKQKRQHVSPHVSNCNPGRCSGCERLLTENGKSPKPVFTVYRGSAKHVFCSGKCFKTGFFK